MSNLDAVKNFAVSAGLSKAPAPASTDSPVSRYAKSAGLEAPAAPTAPMTVKDHLDATIKNMRSSYSDDARKKARYGAAPDTENSNG